MVVHVPSLRALHLISFLREDRGDSVILSNGHFILSIASNQWSSELVRYTGATDRDAKRPGLNLDPERKVPDFDLPGLYPLEGLGREVRKGFETLRQMDLTARLGHLPNVRISSVSVVSSGKITDAVPLICDSWDFPTLVDRRYYVPMERIGCSFVVSPDESARSQAITVLFGGKVAGLLMPLKSDNWTGHGEV